MHRYILMKTFLCPSSPLNAFRRFANPQTDTLSADLQFGQWVGLPAEDEDGETLPLPPALMTSARHPSICRSVIGFAFFWLCP